MAYVDKNDVLWQKLAAVIEDEGLSLYELEKLGEMQLRVAIDRPGVKEAGKGVSSGDCTNVCRRLMVYLSVEGGALGLAREPEIEVSSPGVNRTLRLPEHFAAAVGSRIKVLAAEGAKGSRTLLGTLASFDGENITVLDEQSNQEATVALSRVKKARVEYKF